MVFVLGGPHQGGGGGDVEAAREEMRLIGGRCSFCLRAAIFYYCCADSFDVDRTRMLCCLDAHWLMRLAHIIES